MTTTGERPSGNAPIMEWRIDSHHVRNTSLGIGLICALTAVAFAMYFRTSDARLLLSGAVLTVLLCVIGVRLGWFLPLGVTLNGRDLVVRYLLRNAKLPLEHVRAQAVSQVTEQRFRWGPATLEIVVVGTAGTRKVAIPEGVFGAEQGAILAAIERQRELIQAKG